MLPGILREEDFTPPAFPFIHLKSSVANLIFFFVLNIFEVGNKTISR